VAKARLIPTIREKSRDVFGYGIAGMGLSNAVKIRDYSG
jgi:hypothetical protein